MTRKKKKIKYDRILIFISILASLYFIRSILLLGPIEPLIRYILIGIILTADVLLFFKVMKRKKHNVLSLVSVLLAVLYIFLGFNINKIYSYIDNINKKYISYSSSLVALNKEDTDIKFIKDKKIGVLNDNTSIEGYILAYELIEENNLENKNELVEYESFNSMLLDLLNEKLDYAFLPTTYVDIFTSTEEFEDIGEKTKIIISRSKDEKKEKTELASTGKDIKDPFTILLIGIDSATNGLKNADSFNGDSLNLVTFNPNTLTATMLSIPRDTYVPIACFTGKYENKITHSASKGTNCVINTIQDFLDIKIDYYMKINFTGVVDLVNAVGGVTVDVPYSFCEQDSKRRFGNKMIYVEKGVRTLNGEEALALSRNRKSNSEFCNSKWTQGTRNDFVRGTNQQMVIEALVDSIKSMNSIDHVYDILEAISNNLDTNMPTSTILSFYNIAKDILLKSKDKDSFITIEKLFIAGYGQTIYDETTSLQLWNYVPNKKSVDEIKTAMKENLELKERKVDKSFSYSPSDNYETPIIGKGPYATYTTYDLVPDFTKMTKIEADAWAIQYSMTIEYEKIKNSSLSSGAITKQNFPINKRCDKIPNKKITLTIIENYTPPTTPVKIDCVDPNNLTNNICLLPDFTGNTKTYVNTWANKFSNTVVISYVNEESDEESGTIIKQSVAKGTTVNEVIGDNLTIIITLAE